MLDLYALHRGRLDFEHSWNGQLDSVLGFEDFAITENYLMIAHVVHLVHTVEDAHGRIDSACLGLPIYWQSSSRFGPIADVWVELQLQGSGVERNLLGLDLDATRYLRLGKASHQRTALPWPQHHMQQPRQARQHSRLGSDPNR